MFSTRELALLHMAVQYFGANLPDSFEAFQTNDNDPVSIVGVEIDKITQTDIEGLLNILQSHLLLEIVERA